MSNNLPESISQLIDPVTKDLGEFVVRRTLPDETRQRVGPFIKKFDEVPGETEFIPLPKV